MISQNLLLSSSAPKTRHPLLFFCSFRGTPKKVITICIANTSTDVVVGYFNINHELAFLLTFVIKSYYVVRKEVKY